MLNIKPNVPASPATSRNSAELSDTVLLAVVGGLNPQPLPPRQRPLTLVLPHAR